MNLVSLKRKVIDLAELVMDVKDLQEALGVSKDTAYCLMRSEAFPSMKIGKRYFVEKVALKQWLQKNQGKEFLL